ncbi:metallophosphoesterase family protein [Rhizobium sp.]
MSFRFVHTADIHLDSPLKSLALRDPALSERIGNATRAALSRTVDLCIDEQVDALLISGDLYDGEQTSMKTALFLAGELARLDRAGIRTFIIRGNHDALSKIKLELVLPDSVRVFGPKADAVTIGRPSGADIVIHGISFRDSRAPESLLPKYRPPVEGAINIGMMHTSLGGSLAHDVYAPCSLADLDASGFRYWALGHIHRRSADAGRATVIMPGIPQGRDINEPGAGSVSLVTVADDGAIAVEERIVATARFDRVTVDLTGQTDWADAVGLIGRKLEEASGGDIHRVVRLGLAGATPLAWRLRSEADLLEAEARHLAERIGGISVEKVEIRCVPLETKSATSVDAIGELGRLIDNDVLASAEFAGLAAEAAKELLKSLPPDLRGMLPQEEADFGEALATLARDGVDSVLASLRDPAAGDA